MLKFSGFADLTSCLRMYETYYIKGFSPKAQQQVTSEMFNKLRAKKKSPCVEHVRGSKAL